MKVAQVATSVAEEASGVYYVVQRLSHALAQRGVGVGVHVVDAVPHWGEKVALHSYPRWPFPARLKVSPAMKRGLLSAARSVDIMHNHSLWMMPNVYPAQAVWGTRCRLVCSPHGTLAPWALSRGKWRKRLMWALGQKQVVLKADCLHATAESECEDIRRLGYRGPVALIPHGIELPALATRSNQNGKPRRLLFLGRIHPQKGVDILLKAWAELENQFPDWELQVVGFDDGGHLQAYQGQAADLELKRASFLRPVYGAKKSQAFFEADLFVLPSQTENFGIAIAEALGHGIPVVVSKGTPWAEVEQKQCGWWIDNNVGSVVDCLRGALGLPREQLQAMGQRGRAWMERDFSWDKVGRLMHETYQWLLGGGAPPPWVHRSA